MPASTRLAVPFRPTLLALLCSLTVTAHAADENGKALVLDNVNVNAQAPTSNALPRSTPAVRSPVVVNSACSAIRT